MTWCSKGKEKQLAVKCLPGLSKANEWLARTALPVERTTSHFGPIHHAAIRGGAAEMALEGLNLNTTQMAALFGALPQGETFMEPMNIYTRLAALEKRHAERKRSGGARFMASQNIPLSAQWRNGDGDSGEIAISRIPNVALPDSLAKLRAYLCFYRGNEDARLIPLDLAYEDWQDEGGTLVFDYAVEETKISAAFDDNTAHIDADEVTMTEDSETGETIIRIEAHSLI